MTSTFTNYQLISRDLQKSLNRTASEPIVSRETDYYLKNIGKVKSIDAFLADNRLYKYAMKAYGLEDMTYAKAFMRKALTEGIDSKDSFANRLSDKRYKEFVGTFNFVRYKEATTSFDQAQQGTIDKYVRQSLESSIGDEDSGVRLALYFQRNAASIKSPYDILADPALLQVARTALGFSQEAMGGNVDAQAAMIKRKLDLTSFQKPEGVQRFLQRFASLWDAQNSTASTPVLTLFDAAQTGGGMNVDLLMSLQRIKLGGS
ncbi:DUF1217 domain-containing protein [Microvirga terricola]|uniref:DUF1217 domain-containing protein n=1 Tax=Microvirga terricola TaxID=2719797 RepID=A0ABX0VEZ7_9HYPH|nr:DUF1217 domain-containing protein [Microvirga terricola]NIX78419.1 DUF1217 domain-containing protein [Microvirga terricola]